MQAFRWGIFGVCGKNGYRGGTGVAANVGEDDASLSETLQHRFSDVGVKIAENAYVLQYYDFTTSTGQGAWPMTFSVTLPIRSRLSPVLPWEPTTIMLTFWSWASFTTASQASASPT